METIILFRHGETNKNSCGNIHGMGDEERLNKAGIEQIKKAAEEMRKLVPHKIYSSKEVRAVQSAELISETLDIPWEIADGVEERNWGSLSGKSVSEVQLLLNSLSLEDRYLFTPPEGESWQKFEKRLIEAVHALMEKNIEKTIVVVTHGGAIRVLMPHLLGMPKEESFKHDPDNASSTIFRREQGIFYPVGVNSLAS
jgi:broad specificity phosphatase PhoE